MQGSPGRQMQSAAKPMCLNYLQGIIHLTSAIARNAVKLHAATAASSTLPMLESGIYRAAACMNCNHKDLSSASLSCVGSVIGECSLLVKHRQFYPLMLAPLYCAIVLMWCCCTAI